MDLPGDPLLEQSIAWSKQNLADSVQEAHDLQLRPVEEGREYPAPVGTLAKARWLGAGWPDYPWLFGTDGEYTAFASVAMGQFADIKAHLRALRDVSEVVNGDSGKVVHEVMPDGAIYFGTLDSAGNTDETSKFPSAVALSGGGQATTPSATTCTTSPSATCGTSSAARRGRRRLARGPRQRGARRHGRGEARQHRLHDPRAARPRRHGGRRVGDAATDVGLGARLRPWRRRSSEPGGTAGTPISTPTRSTTRPTRPTTTRRSCSGTGSA